MAPVSPMCHALAGWLAPLFQVATALVCWQACGADCSGADVTVSQAVQAPNPRPQGQTVTHVSRVWVLGRSLSP